MKKKFTSQQIIISTILLIIGIILFYSLIIQPAVGKTDNGDFGRMYKLLGLSDLGATYDEQFDGYFHMIYSVTNLGYLLPWCSNWVIGCLIEKVPYILNIAVHNTNQSYFDIRFVGATYSIIFLSGIYFILKYNKLSNFTKIICGIFIILFFTDAVYISYFNSFFGEAATISCMFLMIGSFLYLLNAKTPTKRHFIFFFISAACFLTSKTQEIPLLLFMLIILFALFKFYKEYKKIILTGSILISCLCIATLYSIDDYTNTNNIYQSVFTGILYDSKDPKADLVELGINPKFSDNAGTSFYDKNLAFDPLDDEMTNEFYPNISLGKVFKFYLFHPQRAFEKISLSADYAYSFYEIDESNFVKGADYKSKLINSFRYNLLQAFPSVHRNIYLYIGFSALYLIAISIYFFKSKAKETKLLCLLLLFILAAGASQLVLPVLGSGVADFGKHLFLINLSYDILVGTVVLWLANSIFNLKFKMKNEK